MLISRKSTTVSSHLNRASQRKHSGIHTVTTHTSQDDHSQTASSKERPFGEIVYGEEAGAPQTAYKPIFQIS